MTDDLYKEYTYQVEVQFSHLLDTLFNVERLFGEESKKYKTHLLEEANKLPGIERETYLEDYSRDLWFIEDLIPSKIRTSILISCYATFEYELLRICKTIGRNNEFPITLNDLKGKGIFLAQTFLEKVVQVTIPGKDDIWPHIIAFNTIRNMIVHNNERFDRNHPKAEFILKYIHTHKDVAGDIIIDEDGYFEISYNYAEFILHNMQNWYVDLFGNEKLSHLLSKSLSELLSNVKTIRTDRGISDESPPSQ